MRLYSVLSTQYCVLRTGSFCSLLNLAPLGYHVCTSFCAPTSSGYPGLNLSSSDSAVLDSLHRLTRRVRWNRWLGRLDQPARLLAVTFLLLFLADSLIGMRTLSLRVASGITLLLAVTLIAVD
jgi:hypothetical protein